jgi:predicted aspartyl protease
MVFVAAWLGGKAVDILLQALLHRVERLTLPIRLPRLSMPHRPKPAMVPRPTEVRREENGIYAYVNVYDLKRRRCVPARLQVDTGANVSLISEDKLKKLGVKPITKAESTLADGRKMMRDVGYALIECRGKESTATVIFGKGKDSEVLGGATIEGLGIGLNFKGRNAGQQTNYHLPYWFGKCGDPAGYVKAVITSKKPQVAFRRLLCDAWTAKSMDDSEAFTNICLAIQEVREKYWNIVKLRRKDDEEAKRITEEGLGIPRGIAGTASVEGEPAPRDVGQQPTDQATSEELEQCGVPKPFKEFTANDEDAAKAEANKGRLVAIYIGRAKWDLYGRKYSYYALPKNVAEQLVAGKIVKPESQNEDDVYRQLCYREYLKGEGEGYRLQSERLKTDLTWQLLRLKSPKEYIV